MIVVVVLPFLEFLVERTDVAEDDTVEQAVELFGVDAVGAFDLAVEPRGGGTDVDMTDALVEQVPVKRRLELGSVAFLTDVKPLGGV